MAGQLEALCCSSSPYGKPTCPAPQFKAARARRNVNKPEAKIALVPTECRRRRKPSQRCRASSLSCTSPAGTSSKRWHSGPPGSSSGKTESGLGHCREGSSGCWLMLALVQLELTRVLYRGGPTIGIDRTRRGPQVPRPGTVLPNSGAKIGFRPAEAELRLASGSVARGGGLGALGQVECGWWSAVARPTRPRLCPHSLPGEREKSTPSDVSTRPDRGRLSHCTGLSPVFLGPTAAPPIGHSCSSPEVRGMYEVQQCNPCPIPLQTLDRPRGSQRGGADSKSGRCLVPG